MGNFTFQIDAPYITFEEYSRRTGCPISLIRREVRDGRLPIKTKTNPQETPYVNMVALYQQANSESHAA